MTAKGIQGLIDWRHWTAYVLRLHEDNSSNNSIRKQTPRSITGVVGPGPLISEERHYSRSQRVFQTQIQK
jgi:hypothetical protein